MKIVKRQPSIVSRKILANVSENFARAFGLPEGHRNVGFFSTDNDDIAYIAADDATKKARIHVQTSVTYYGGSMFSEYDYTGTVFILFSSERIQDVKSAMGYIEDFVENNSELYCFDGDRGTGFYAQTISRAGSFFEEWAHVPKGQAYSYICGAPVETNMAMDKALKSGNVKISRFFPSPTHANSCGAILTGTESACRAATEAFIEALHQATANPMSL